MACRPKKHISVSKAVAFAIFATALILAFGPNFWPEKIDPLPKELKYIALGAMVYSGTLLLVWTVNYSAKLVRRIGIFALHRLRARSLSKEKEVLIKWMGSQGNDPVNLRIKMQNDTGL